VLLFELGPEKEKPAENCSTAGNDGKKRLLVFTNTHAEICAGKHEHHQQNHRSLKKI
jgi:hypothetical protein